MYNAFKQCIHLNISISCILYLRYAYSRSFAVIIFKHGYCRVGYANDNNDSIMSLNDETRDKPLCKSLAKKSNNDPTYNLQRNTIW